jgi:small-conductance mechanosensitive channel
MISLIKGGAFDELEKEAAAALNVEPRIFSFFEPYGINISVWYMNNSYGTLALRSTISSEIIEALNAESDIKIAYPKQTLFISRHLDTIQTQQLDIDKENLD